MTVFLTETFDTSGTPGYDNTWSETVGAGCTVDENNTDINDPTAGSSDILQIIKASGNNAYTSHELGEEKNPTYTRLYFYISAEGLDNGEIVTLWRPTQDDWWVMYYVSLKKDGADLRLEFKYTDDGGWTSDLSSQVGGDGVLDLNTWYYVEVYWNTNTEYEWKINGISEGSDTLSNDRGGVRRPTIGDGESSVTTITVYFDFLKIQDNDWVGEESEEGNVYNESLTEIASMNSPIGLRSIYGMGLQEGLSMGEIRQPQLKYELGQREVFSLMFSLLPQFKHLLAKTEICSVFDSLIPQLKYQVDRIEIASLLATVVPRLIYKLLQEEEISLTDTIAGILTAYFKQEGFRWRNDDGSESAASWRQLQDVDDTIGKITNIRLRVIVDARGDPDASQFQLEYKESNDPASEWRKVPIN